jgi:predicted small integral membrane protein
MALWRARKDSASAFHRAKKWVYIAAMLAMLVWFFGFMVIGSEVFLMWQSPTWNGQQAAFRFYMSVLGVLIYINQADIELPKK